jgi:hypothetical protein
MATELKPGSDAALAQGCTCPVMDNAHGKGFMGQAGAFVTRGNCPLHGGATFKSTHGAGVDIGDSFGKGLDLPEHGI